MRRYYIGYMKITLLAVGSIKKSWIQEGCSDYLGRMDRGYSCEVVELKPSKQKEPQKQLEEESQTILSRLQKMDGKVLVLDERGEGLISPAFSTLLSDAKDRGQSLIFIIGGAYGLSDEIRSRADMLISLSDMTLPHELCRIFFLEQLYRAQQIMKGSGYHHA